MAAADMAGAVGTAVAADTAVVSVLDVPDTLRPPTSRLDTSWLGMDPVYTSPLDIAPARMSRVDTAAISGMAVGGITALARAGYGRTFTVSTCGGAIEVLQSAMNRMPITPPLGWPIVGLSPQSLRHWRTRGRS